MPYIDSLETVDMEKLHIALFNRLEMTEKEQSCFMYGLRMNYGKFKERYINLLELFIEANNATTRRVTILSRIRRVNKLISFMAKLALVLIIALAIVVLITSSTIFEGPIGWYTLLIACVMWAVAIVVRIILDWILSKKIPHITKAAGKLDSKFREEFCDLLLQLINEIPDSENHDKIEE